MSRSEELCAGIRNLHEEAVELADSVFFMAKKLEESRAILESEPLVIEYDNGGGQKGIRENPHYTAYEHLLASYTKALRQLSEMVDNGAPTRKASNIMKELTVIAGKKVG